MHWALDFGTSNTLIATQAPGTRQAEIVEIPGVGTATGLGDALNLDQPKAIPSAIHLQSPDLWAKLGRIPLVQKGFFVGTQARIGQEALDRNRAFPDPAFAEQFKAAWMHEPTRTLARVGAQKYSAREAGTIFLRELFAHIWKHRRQRPTEITLAVPVESYEPFRAELGGALHHLGITCRFVDEPVAAALGYGVSLEQPRRVLLFDMGGGTMHIASVEFFPRQAMAGTCTVLGKWGAAIGGRSVDQWILEQTALNIGRGIPEDASEDLILWRSQQTREARRVKEALHTQEDVEFFWTVPEEIRGLAARLGRSTRLRWTRADLLRLLEQKKLFMTLETGVSQVAGAQPPDEVLLTGGSSLLPGVYAWFEQRYGRDRVRAWHPFEAVVRGAAALAAGEAIQSDVVVHDYALQTHDRSAKKAQHTVIIPRGTRFPTAPDFWRQTVVPACAHGEPERIFKLHIAELGSTVYSRDTAGNLSPAAAEPVIVPLNAANPVLGVLDPPQSPDDRTPRLELMFGIDADRWLVATVKDLKTQKLLMKAQPVVRLL